MDRRSIHTGLARPWGIRVVAPVAVGNINEYPFPLGLAFPSLSPCRPSESASTFGKHVWFRLDRLCTFSRRVALADRGGCDV